MKYPIASLSIVEVAQIVKAFLLIGSEAVTVKKIEEGRYQITTSNNGR